MADLFGELCGLRDIFNGCGALKGNGMPEVEVVEGIQGYTIDDRLCIR